MNDLEKASLSLKDVASTVPAAEINIQTDLSSVCGPIREVEATAPNSVPSYSDAIQSTVTWLSGWAPWSSAEPAKQTATEVPPTASLLPISIAPVDLVPTTIPNSETEMPISQAENWQVFDWFAGLFTSQKASSETKLSAPVCQPDGLDSSGLECRELAIVSPKENTQPILSQLATVSSTAIGTVQYGVANALIAGIRSVSAERDRDEIIRWFMNAREILARNGSATETATALYQTSDTIRFAQLLANTVGTSINSYHGANLPLALKVAVPVTLVGAGYFGMQGAGLLAFGTGIGLPVVLLLFLGTAGATTVVEAFVMDRSVRDPLTKLLLMFVAFENARRAKKELLDAMRADAMVPERAQVPSDFDEVLSFLMDMDPVAFERHVMSFFEKDGHPTGLTARSNDFGVDGYVFHPDGVIVVQCKRNGADNPVGRPTIQQFKGVIEEQRAFKGYVVTTSRFTDEAKESAAKSNRILLVNGEDLVRWHKEGRILHPEK